MERDEFIKNLGLGLIAVCGASTLAACSSKGTPGPSTTPPPVGGGNTVSVDLSTKLLNVNDQIVSGSVLIFRIASANVPASFVATEAVCPHAGGSLGFIPAQALIQCSLHQSQYSETGKVLAQPVGGGATRALKIYATTVTGSTLTVTVA